MGLGGYASETPALSGAIASTLLADPTVRIVQTELGDRLLEFRYADRRLAGADWLADFSAAPLLQRKRLVFASIKGGVGRSTALSVLAADLAQSGKRVLAIDLDLEAPGIGFMLLPASQDAREDRRPRFGALDYLVETGVSGVTDESLVDFIGTSTFAKGAIDVLPVVGRETDDRPHELIPKLARGLIEDVSGDDVIPLWKQMSEMVSRFEQRGDYDVVLIDARAGLSEITAAPLMTMGANVFLFATDQEQTFRGYRYLLTYLVSQTDFSTLDPDQDWRQRVNFVQAKAPPTERGRSTFTDRLYDLCSEILYEDASDDDVAPPRFTFGPSETGPGVPHDATHVRYDSAYDAFDPTIEGDQLDPEVYSGPFGSFLRRANSVLGSGEQHNERR
jgi:Mrp family chromosome partitioning ATPase